jgi:hypothetical protein
MNNKLMNQMFMEHHQVETVLRKQRKGAKLSRGNEQNREEEKKASAESQIWPDKQQIFQA